MNSKDVRKYLIAANLGIAVSSLLLPISIIFIFAIVGIFTTGILVFNIWFLKKSKKNIELSAPLNGGLLGGYVVVSSLLILFFIAMVMSIISTCAEYQCSGYGDFGPPSIEEAWAYGAVLIGASIMYLISIVYLLKYRVAIKNISPSLYIVEKQGLSEVEESTALPSSSPPPAQPQPTSQAQSPRNSAAPSDTPTPQS